MLYPIGDKCKGIQWDFHRRSLGNGTPLKATPAELRGKVLQVRDNLRTHGSNP